MERGIAGGVTSGNRRLAAIALSGHMCGMFSTQILKTSQEHGIKKQC